jgi:hypothetical protein
MQREVITAVASDQTYAVAIDRSSLAETELLGLGKGYCVGLVGTIDANWLGCYRKLRVDSPSFFRFCLEDRRVLFACRAGDALTDVTSILGTLDVLLKRANELASASLPSD